MLQPLLPHLLFLCLLAFVLGEPHSPMNPASTSAGDAYAADAPPGARPLDVDGYPLAPPELELEQVHVYVRHGALFLPGLRTKTVCC